MFCSTVIPTIGRSSLERAVNSVLGQVFTADDFEIIVVNDSGRVLEKAAWHNSPRVQIINTNQHERSVARNVGAAIATGKYLHFLDDDDWLLPGALNTFWELTQQASKANWVYGGSQLVDRDGNKLIKLQPDLEGNCFCQVMAGEWIPLQSSLIKVDAFFGIGGFNPLLAGPEDVDLCRRFCLHHDLAYTAQTVACIGKGTTGSTTDYQAHPAKSRWAREQVLNEPHAFKRMRGSARFASWHGRIVRIYLTSVVWNLQHGRISTATSRTLFGVAGFLLAGKAIISPSFYRAIAHSYRSETFARGLQNPVT